jgi:site-specific DNA recombinase
VNCKAGGKPIVLVWWRVSGDDQREISPETQQREAIALAEHDGYVVPPDYVIGTDWYSLSVWDSPPMNKVKELVSSSAVHAVFMYDADRSPSKPAHRLLLRALCEEYGVKIRCCHGQIPEGEMGEVMEFLSAWSKEKQVLRAQQGARDGLRDRARLHGLPPNPHDFFGYHWDKHQHRFVPTDMHPVAAEIWQLALRGRKAEAIVKELDRRAVLSPSGKVGWRPNAVRHILHNRGYAGVIEALRTQAVEPKYRKKQTYGKSGRRVRPQNERIRLVGLVERPIITEEEFALIQERLHRNQQFATKNTRLRVYLLRGMVQCAACGRVYLGTTLRRRAKQYAYYVCGGRWQPGPRKEPCRSHSLGVNTIEEAVFSTVVDFLRGPEVVEAELHRKGGITEESEASLRRELADLQRQERTERDAEARAFRLAARGTVSEEVYQQEVGLIHTKQRWIAEQTGRLEQQLADLERYRFNPQSVELLRQRLESRLVGATAEDKRFVLEALGTKVMVQSDGTWELELQVPHDLPPAATEPLQVVNGRPELVEGGTGLGGRHGHRRLFSPEWI